MRIHIVRSLFPLTSPSSRGPYSARHFVNEVPTTSQPAHDDVIEEDSSSSSLPPPHLEYFAWSPKGNGFVYVFRGNIYFKPSVESKKVFPITTGAIPKVITNGIPDWVYEGKKELSRQMFVETDFP